MTPIYWTPCILLEYPVYTLQTCRGRWDTVANGGTWATIRVITNQGELKWIISRSQMPVEYIWKIKTDIDI